MAAIKQEPSLGHWDGVCFIAPSEGYSFGHLCDPEIKVLIHGTVKFALSDLRRRWIQEFSDHLENGRFGIEAPFGRRRRLLPQNYQLLKARNGVYVENVCGDVREGVRIEHLVAGWEKLSYGVFELGNEHRLPSSVHIAEPKD